MTTSMSADKAPCRIIVGVDTHKHIHVAAAIDTLGVRLADRSFAADSGGYLRLAEWAESLGRIESIGIEGTGSYGAGLASALRRCGHRIVEVNRGNRQTRRANGKSDTADAEIAARQVLAGVAKAVPKSADGRVEMIRQLKVARDTAVKARTSVMITLKQIVVNSRPELREVLSLLNDKTLINRCAGFRVSKLTDTTASAKYTLRTLARRWLTLNNEIAEADRYLDELTTDVAPTMRQAFGVGPDTAAEMLIIFGDNPERIRSDAAFAKLCGACPVPASSGMTSGRHRLYTGGHRQANAALYRSVIVRMRFHEPTIEYVNRRTAEGLGKREIIRCLKRFLAREVYQHVMTDHRARQALLAGA
ncbi:MAG: IS110 family transposase [Acidimicrobiaceae bacterium]|nr:IS110 family transposase [Acidimicrobiaceae bacterium]